ncbi:MAG: tetratricopeptide repeat protein [Candidatus Paceibacterota bacterium]|jgi:tetratricopeptide (TPR) repeat protein
MKKFKKEAYIEQYEKNLAIFGLFVFIVFGVIFMTFLLPSIYNIKNNPNTAPDNNASVSTYNTKQNLNSYKSGLASAKNTNYSEALSFFESAVEKEPNNIEYLTELAMTHYRLKNYDKSTEIYNRIISLEKNNVFAYNSIGNNYWIKKDFTNAETSFRKAIQIDPYSIPSYSNLALMLDELGRKQEAINVLSQGLAANENNSELKILLRILQ